MQIRNAISIVASSIRERGNMFFQVFSKSRPAHNPQNNGIQEQQLH
jgi:hypothetical protein